MFLYAFDLKIKGKKAYNTLKRRFYYSLAKTNLSSSFSRTKSVFLVPIQFEKEADVFFSQWEGFIVVYKARVSDFKRLC